MKKNWIKWLKSTLAEAGYKEGDCLVVGVSGGADSLALLHQLREIFGPAVLQIAHLDHGIRPGSAADAKFVAGLAQSWGIPFSGKQVDVPELSKRQGWSLEEAARNARYEFLADVARTVGARIVAVGHNSDDQAETILLHFLRGSGLSGLRGMSPLSPYPGAPDLKLVRPLLYQSRDEIETYCNRHNLTPVVDETNSDPAYQRNRIRHQLLPALYSYNPQIKSQLLQLAAITAAEDDIVGALFDEIWPELFVQMGPGWLCLDRQAFGDLPTALKRRAIRRAVKTLNSDTADLSFKAVEQAVELANRTESGTETMLPEALTMFVDYETLIFSREPAGIPVDLPQLLMDQTELLPIPGRVELANDWRITAQFVEKEAEAELREQNPWLAEIDLPGRDFLTIRTRQSGERMQPLGLRGHSASLQDIMVNRKLAARLRDKWPLVATEDHVVWLTGHIIDHRVRVVENSRRVVRLTCERKGEET